jgi:hypothetical protein
MNFKVITAANWMEPDPVLRYFVRLNTQSGEISRTSAEEWVAAFMEPRLGEGVPEQVAELVEAARGAMLYGWFFYSLYAMAEDQLFIAAEAALRERYVAVTGAQAAHERLPRFNRLRIWALKQGLIGERDRIWWEGAERLRNATTHTPIQRLAGC